MQKSVYEKLCSCFWKMFDYCEFKKINDDYNSPISFLCRKTAQSHAVEFSGKFVYPADIHDFGVELVKHSQEMKECAEHSYMKPYYVLNLDFDYDDLEKTRKNDLLNFSDSFLQIGLAIQEEFPDDHQTLCLDRVTKDQQTIVAEEEKGSKPSKPKTNFLE